MTESNTFIHYIKNGVYIPFLYIPLYYSTNNLFLTNIIISKLYPANYYFFFNDYYYYKDLPKWFSLLKQFIRFTDTGHIASLIYFLYPDFFPLSFNIHFVITFGFWGSILFFNMIDLDERYSPEIMTNFATLWSFRNHIVPFILFVRELWIKPELCSQNMFNINNLYNSYLWLYSWFFLIYVPWRLLTGDCVYNMLSYDTSINKLLIFIVFIHNLFIIANLSGLLLQYIIC
jgi:hypothetical protein